MKAPTWAMIVGIVVILNGGCGILSNVKKINTPSTLDAAEGIIKEVQIEINQELKKKDTAQVGMDTAVTSETEVVEISDSASTSIDSNMLGDIESVFGSMDKLLVFSDYYKKWIVILGKIGVVISALDLLGGLLLVIGQKYAIKSSYIALGLSTLFMIFQIIIMSYDSQGGAISRWRINFGAYFMIALNVIILIIIAASDKTYFYQKNIIEE